MVQPRHYKLFQSQRTTIRLVLLTLDILPLDDFRMKYDLGTKEFELYNQ